MLQGTVQVFFLFAPNAVLVPLVSQDRYGAGTYAWVSAATLVAVIVLHLSTYAVLAVPGVARLGG